MLTEGQVRVPLSVLEERRELDLLPKGVPAPDSLSLPPLGVSATQEAVNGVWRLEVYPDAVMVKDRTGNLRK